MSITEEFIRIEISGIKSQKQVDNICTNLQTSINGLSSNLQHLDQRQKTFGKNDYPKVSSLEFKKFGGLLIKSARELQPLFIRNLLLIYIILLVLLIIITGVFDSEDEDLDEPDWLAKWGQLLEFFVCLLLIVLVPVLMEAGLTYKKQSQISKILADLGENWRKVQVKRDEEFKNVSIREVVVGDVIQLNAGDLVPVDGAILQNNEFVLEENVLTSNAPICCTAGSIVSSGNALILVLSVGDSTKLSLLAQEISGPKQPIKVGTILPLAIGLGLLAFIGRMFKYTVYIYIIQREEWDMRHLQRFVAFFTQGIVNFFEIIPFALPFVIILTFYKTKERSIALHRISKFLQFKLTLNLVIVLLRLTDILMNYKFSLSAVQYLWIQIFSNILGFLLYPSDPEDEYDTFKMGDNDQVIPSPNIILQTFGQAFFQTGTLVILLVFGGVILDYDPELWTEPTTHTSMIFTVLVLMTLFHLVSVRGSVSKRNIFSGIFKHPIFCASWVIALILQFVIVQVGGLAFKTYPLRIEQIFFCLFLGLAVFIWGQILICISSINIFRNKESVLESQNQNARNYQETTGL